MNRKGFTLLEVLLVLIIIGISIGITMPTDFILRSQRISKNIEEISSDIRKMSFKAREGRNEQIYIIDQEKLDSKTTFFKTEIVYLEDDSKEEIYLINESEKEILDVIELRADSRGKIYKIQKNKKKYIKEIKIEMKSNNVQQSITISGITGILIKKR